MFLSNLHTHTCFCDGKDTPREMIERALELGLAELGFSGHSYTPFDLSYCMTREKTRQYIEEVGALKKEYKGKIHVLLGIEQDYFSDEKTDPYEYVIGSVHYVKKGGVYLPVDKSEESFRQNVALYYGGDYYAFCEDYYSLVGDVFDRTRCDIVGHFDLVTKFNEGGKLFDENHERYQIAVDNALQKLFRTGVTFEINYGAIARGYRKTPYPDETILEKIRKNGSPVIVTSDCHDKDKLQYGIVSQ